MLCVSARLLFGGITANPEYAPISLGIGEPKHPTPPFIQRALTHNIQGLASYPSTHGSDALREAIAATMPAPLAALLRRASEDADWCARHGAAGIDQALKTAAVAAFGPARFIHFTPNPR